MNKVILLGFLSQEPVIKQFPEKNLVMTKFSIAVNDSRNYNQSFFFNCIAWNQTAEYVSVNLHKGDFVSIDGRLTNRSYINESGAKVYITEIIVDTIRNLGSKKIKDEEMKTNNQKVNVDELINNSIDQNEQIKHHDDDFIPNQDEEYGDIDWDDDGE